MKQASNGIGYSFHSSSKHKSPRPTPLPVTKIRHQFTDIYDEPCYHILPSGTLHTPANSSEFFLDGNRSVETLARGSSRPGAL